MNIFTSTSSDPATPLTTFLLFASPHLSLFQGFIGPVLMALGLFFFPFYKPGVHGEMWWIPCLLSCSLWLMAVSSHQFLGTMWYRTGFPHLWSISQGTEKNWKNQSCSEMCNSSCFYFSFSFSSFTTQSTGLDLRVQYKILFTLPEQWVGNLFGLWGYNQDFTLKNSITAALRFQIPPIDLL